MLQKLKSVGIGVARDVARGAGAGAKKASTKVKERAGKKGEEYLVALDIGTEFIKALVGRVNEDSGTIDIIGVGRAHQGLSDMQAGAISDIAAVVENCDKAL
ncbi:MAG TPA: hypothetical protein VMU97_01810, partial [Candidatus Dormibacteraeota bacterium]|nr:hypothetical protein [Candidatus Dormibacteraeota bacterium]